MHSTTCTHDMHPGFCALHDTHSPVDTPRTPPQESHDTPKTRRGVHRGVQCLVSWSAGSWRACRGVHGKGCRGVHRGMQSWTHTPHVVECINRGGMSWSARCMVSWSTSWTTIVDTSSTCSGVVKQWLEPCRGLHRGLHREMCRGMHRGLHREMCRGMHRG